MLPHHTYNRGACSWDRMAAAIWNPLVGSLSSLRSPPASRPSSRRRETPLCLKRGDWKGTTGQCLSHKACLIAEQRGLAAPSAQGSWVNTPTRAGQQPRVCQPWRRLTRSHDVAHKQHQVCGRLHGVDGAHGAPQPLLRLGDRRIVQGAGLGVQRVLRARHVRVGEQGLDAGWPCRPGGQQKGLRAWQTVQTSTELGTCCGRRHKLTTRTTPPEPSDAAGRRRSTPARTARVAADSSSPLMAPSRPLHTQQSGATKPHSTVAAAAKTALLELRQ